MSEISELNTRGIFEEEILYRLLNDRSYFGSTVTYLKPSYFSDIGNSIVFSHIKNYHANSGEMPNIKDIILLIKDEPQSKRQAASNSIRSSMSAEVHANDDLVLKKTEDFIRKALHTESLIMGSEAMRYDDTAKLNESFALAEEAQKVSLDSDFGTSIRDIEECIAYYQDDTMGLLTGIESFDSMIGKGFREKTLHTFLAPPGIGKSATMAAFAAQFLLQGKDIVVFTLEMDEAEWMKRIYANILNIDISTLESIEPEVIRMRWREINHNLGTLIVKEYPSYTLNALQMQNFLEKYIERSGVKNPIVFLDYLGLMNSARLPAGTASYEYVKSITAEVRSVAQKLNIIIFTAHQLNRSAVGNLEAGQEAVSDSAGISMFSDSMMFILQTKEMKALGELLINFEKNRMAGKTYTFKIGFSYTYMRFIDKYVNKGTNVTSSNVGRTDDELGLPIDPLSDLLSPSSTSSGLSGLDRLYDSSEWDDLANI